MEYFVFKGKETLEALLMLCGKPSSHTVIFVPTYSHTVLVAQGLTLGRAVNFTHEPNSVVLPLFCELEPIGRHLFAMPALVEVKTN